MIVCECVGVWVGGGTSGLTVEEWGRGKSPRIDYDEGSF